MNWIKTKDLKFEVGQQIDGLLYSKEWSCHDQKNDKYYEVPEPEYFCEIVLP